ncbi:MAG: ammonium transporter protein [Candidatus Scalindua rubra]|uniref:Ammonium transporter n=1 Tax=Candidatus Scalindua rubra TaxID=1872076 RepID=A0A1E3XCK6_9BACT|nr:MAG: ammonium transporter protein [Candidatus Scalindua rubra]
MHFKLKNVLLYLLIAGFTVFLLFGISEAADPTGDKTFSLDLRGINLSSSFTWILVCGFMIWFMQVGFAMLGGLLPAKNMLSYMTHCFIATTLGVIIYWFVGFGVMFGGFEFLGEQVGKGNSFMGLSGFMLLGDAYDVRTILLFIFQACIATFIGSIIAGAIAERMKLCSYVLMFFFVYIFIYPVYGHWIWGEGWLWSLPYGVGVRDFAGSGVVHAIGGTVGFVGACFLGPRAGRYNEDGTTNSIPGHNVGYMILGTIVLAVGWLFYDAGGTMAAGDLRTSVIAANTCLSGSIGAVTVLFVTYLLTGHTDVGEACNGALAGLVAISAPCAYVAPWAAVLIGFLGSLIYLFSVWLIANKFKVDDPLGACSVHGTNGFWGLIAIGIFADGSYGGVHGVITGHFGQLAAQLIACVVAFAWAGGLAYIVFTLIGGIGKNDSKMRVAENVEKEGLDEHIHGTSCYPAQ